MLDLLVKNGRVVTPHGAGGWDVAVQGERIVAVTPPGTFTEAARTIDATGMVVVPGGVEPHTQLAHRITMHPVVKDDFHVSDYSPWEGWPVRGWPVTTILRGKVIVERGKLLGDLTGGRLVTRKIDPVMLRRPGC
jgi:dihydroorotase-like cyclic amidohydrolase